MSLQAIREQQAPFVAHAVRHRARRGVDHRGHDRDLRDPGALEKEMSVLGTQTFQVQNGLGVRRRGARRKAMRRPPVTLEKPGDPRARPARRPGGSELWHFRLTSSRTGARRSTRTSRCAAARPNTRRTTLIMLASEGTSRVDVRAGRKVAVIGYGIARKLFPFSDPIDRRSARRAEVPGRGCFRREEIGVRRPLHYTS